MVKIMRFEGAPNGHGGTNLSWKEVGTTEGVIDMLSGDEILAEDKLGRKSSHIYITFTFADIREKDRLVAGDSCYRVKYVDDPMGMGRQMEVLLEWEGYVDEVKL